MSLLEILLEEFRLALFETNACVTRRAFFPEAAEMIKVAIGMRRSGKTYFLYQFIRHLLKNTYPAISQRLLPVPSQPIERTMEMHRQEFVIFFAFLPRKIPILPVPQ